jgi:uncharacterized protein (DUF362 family)
MSAVGHIASLDAGYPKAVASALERVGLFAKVPRGGRVLLKPNLTFPEYRPGVTTSIEHIAATVEALRGAGLSVVVGEADSGGYNRFSMDAVFEKTGVLELCRRTGAEPVNLSHAPAETLSVPAGVRTLAVPVPRLLREVDAVVSLPVPKIHMNTGVSFSIKNLWGCIREPSYRLKLHPHFARVVHAVARHLPRAFALVDGRVGLDRSGPLRGDPVDLGWVLGCDDLVAADRACCRLLGVDEARVAHLQHFRARGWWPDSTWNDDLARFRRRSFRLERAATDWPGVLAFHSTPLAWLAYESPLADVAHKLLYLVREPFYDYDEERQKLRGAG